MINYYVVRCLQPLFVYNWPIRPSASPRVAKDVLVKLCEEYVPVDFVVLDMGGDEETHLILGRPFSTPQTPAFMWGLAKFISTLVERKKGLPLPLQLL